MSRRVNKLNHRNKDSKSSKWQSQSIDYIKGINVAMGLSLLATAKKNKRTESEE